MKQRGVVRYFDDRRGCGWIRPEDGISPDIFVHHSGIVGTGRRTLHKDQIVEFEVAERLGKSCAVKVRVVSDDEKVVA